MEFLIQADVCTLFKKFEVFVLYDFLKKDLIFLELDEVMLLLAASFRQVLCCNELIFVLNEFISVEPVLARELWMLFSYSCFFWWKEEEMKISVTTHILPRILAGLCMNVCLLLFLIIVVITNFVKYSILIKTRSFFTTKLSSFPFIQQSHS